MVEIHRTNHAIPHSGATPHSTTPPSAFPPAHAPNLRDRLDRHAVTIAGKDGQPHRARLINESDASALQRCYEALSEEGKWFRMLHRLPHLPEDMAARFCAPDPRRDICIVLEGEGPLEGEILGEVRVTGERNGESLYGTSAEYAVTLRPEAEGLGLARQALELVFKAAKEMGYTHIWGTIHSENGPMLQLAQKLHLRLHRDPDDAALMVSEGEL